MSRAEDVLSFWFGTLKSDADYPVEKATKWFKKDTAFDEEIRKRFGADAAAAARGERAAWEAMPRGRLALVVLLDQFPRNLYRDDPRAFAQDGKAAALVADAIERGWDRKLRPAERGVFYLPLMHAEDRELQKLSVFKYAELVDEAPAAVKLPLDYQLDYARRHKEIVDRFGRYPHRNEVLGRASTPEEIAFLKEPGSSF